MTEYFITIRLLYLDDDIDLYLTFKTLTEPTKQFLLDKIKDKINESQLEEIRNELMFTKIKFTKHYGRNSFLVNIHSADMGHIHIQYLD